MSTPSTPTSTSGQNSTSTSTSGQNSTATTVASCSKCLENRIRIDQLYDMVQKLSSAEPIQVSPPSIESKPKLATVTNAMVVLFQQQNDAITALPDNPEASMIEEIPTSIKVRQDPLGKNGITLLNQPEIDSFISSVLAIIDKFELKLLAPFYKSADSYCKGIHRAITQKYSNAQKAVQKARIDRGDCIDRWLEKAKRDNKDDEWVDQQLSREAAYNAVIVPGDEDSDEEAETMQDESPFRLVNCSLKKSTTAWLKVELVTEPAPVAAGSSSDSNKWRAYLTKLWTEDREKQQKSVKKAASKKKKRKTKADFKDSGAAKETVEGDSRRKRKKTRKI